MDGYSAECLPTGIADLLKGWFNNSIRAAQRILSKDLVTNPPAPDSHAADVRRQILRVFVRSASLRRRLQSVSVDPKFFGRTSSSDLVSSMTHVSRLI